MYTIPMAMLSEYFLKFKLRGILYYGEKLFIGY